MSNSPTTRQSPLNGQLFFLGVPVTKEVYDAGQNAASGSATFADASALKAWATMLGTQGLTDLQKVALSFVQAAGL